MKKHLASITVFWWIMASIVVFLYIPLLAGEHGLRLDQIKNHMLADAALPTLGSDSLEYAHLAENLVNNGNFSLDAVAPFHPETFRTIGYPLFMAFFLSLGLPFFVIPIIQIILAVGTCFFIYKIGQGFFSSKVGMIAAVLYLIDPVTILHSLILESDVLYVFLIVAAIYFLLVKVTRNKIGIAALGGILLSLSTLVRPISVFLLFVVLVIYMIREYRAGADMRNAAAFATVCILSYGLILIPYLVRNREVSGVYGISTIKSYNLFHYYVPEYLSYKKGISPDEARILLESPLILKAGNFDERSLSNASIMQKEAFRYIFADPFGYGTFHLVKTAPFFFSSGVENFFVSYNQVAGRDAFSFESRNMTNFILKGDIRGFLSALAANPLVAIEQCILLLFFVMALASLWISWKRNQFEKVLILWIIVAYFALLTGPVAYSRYRLPATPFIFMLVAYAAASIYETSHLHSKNR